MEIKNINDVDFLRLNREVTLIVPAQNAKLGPPVGPILGQVKIKVKDFKAHSVVTFELMKRIRQKHPHEDFVWIMGEDNLQNFHLS